MFFDSHAHLTLEPIYPNLPDILDRAKANHVEKIVNICTDKVSLERGLDLINTESFVVHAGATTPHDVEQKGELHFPFFAQAAREKKLVAIGETGLDYHYKHSSVATQQTFLRRYLNLALAHNLPVIFHCRNAFEDLFAITKDHYQKAGQSCPAVLHCFTGTMKEAQIALSRGWLLSFSGIVTFKKSDELREVVKITPLEQMLIETDSPYLAPTGYRGQQNEPSFIGQTAQLIADVKEISLEKVAKVTAENGYHFFQKLL